MKKSILFLITTLVSYGLNIGDIPPNITLEKSNGGDAQGKAWHSKTLKGKVHTLLYMDPDKRDDVKLLLSALNKLSYTKKNYTTVAIVNLAATWMPNAVLESKLKSKQKELKNMEYIFDKNKFLIKKWHLKDDACNVLILNKKGEVIYQKTGIFMKKNVQNIMQLIDTNIKDKK
jgi:predicted transcriptional regulator